MENYKIYSNKWTCTYNKLVFIFERIFLIILIIVSLISIVLIPLGIRLIILFIRDLKKNKSYIEFTPTNITIKDYQKWKYIDLEIPYNDIEEIKCFVYDANYILPGNHRDNYNFNIYIKGEKDAKLFTIKKQLFESVEEEKIKKILELNNVKIYIEEKGIF